MRNGIEDQGLPAFAAPRAAAVMPASQSVDNVPILIVTAPEIAANSPASSFGMHHGGEAPAASITLAAMFIATKLVMHCTSGGFVRMAVSRVPGVVWFCISSLSGGAETRRGGDAAHRNPERLLRQHYLVQVQQGAFSPSCDGRPCSLITVFFAEKDRPVISKSRFAS